MNILVVDDSPTMQSMISSTLENAGFKVSIAEHGVVGLRMLKDYDPDLIISDLNMYEMDGFECVTRVRERDEFSCTPILFLTTEDAEDLKQVGRDIGATGWVKKPFQPDELVGVVRSILEHC